MDRKLQLIAHLYGEPADDLESLGSLLEEGDLRAEYEFRRDPWHDLREPERYSVLVDAASFFSR